MIQRKYSSNSPLSFGHLERSSDCDEITDYKENGATIHDFFSVQCPNSDSYSEQAKVYLKKLKSDIDYYLLCPGEILLEEVMWTVEVVSKIRNDIVNATIFASEECILHSLCRLNVTKAFCIFFQNEYVKADIKDNRSCTPLMIAVRNQNTDIVHALVVRGANTYLADINGLSALDYADQVDNSFLRTLLLSNNHLTTIMSFENEEHVKNKFTEHNIDVNKADVTGTIPIEAAINLDKLIVLRFLLENGADVNATLKNGICILYHCCFTGNCGALQIILSHTPPMEFGNLRPVDVNGRSCNGLSAIDLSASNGRIDIVCMLINAGAIFNELDSRAPILNVACQKEPLTTVEFLILNGAQVNLSDQEGNTPLHSAAFWDRCDILLLFVRHGAAIHSVNNSDETPLCIATKNDHPNAVALIIVLKWCSEMDVQSSDVEVLEQVSRYVNDGTIVQFASGGEFSPLFWCIQNGHVASCKVLIAGGCCVNSTGNGDKTPLGLACELGSEVVVRLLLGAGADLERLSNGLTPIDIARNNGHGGICELLGGFKCVICFTNPRNVLVLPCRHLVACGSCVNNIIMCPICRIRIMEVCWPV